MDTYRGRIKQLVELTMMACHQAARFCAANGGRGLTVGFDDQMYENFHYDFGIVSAEQDSRELS